MFNLSIILQARLEDLTGGDMIQQNLNHTKI